MTSTYVRIRGIVLKVFPVTASIVGYTLCHFFHTYVGAQLHLLRPEGQSKLRAHHHSTDLRSQKQSDLRKHLGLSSTCYMCPFHNASCAQTFSNRKSATPQEDCSFLDSSDQAEICLSQLQCLCNSVGEVLPFTSFTSLIYLKITHVPLSSVFSKLNIFSFFKYSYII